MREDRRATLLGLVALAGLAAVVLGRFPARGEAYLGGDRLAQYAPFRGSAAIRAKNPVDQDPVLCTFPRAASVSSSLHAGLGAPRWEPGLGAGEPLALVNATAPDYPPWRLAYAFLPAWAAHATLLLVHLALALAGAFLLSRARGRSVEASLAGAAVYGLSGQLSTWLELDLWTIAASFVPWALLGVELALARSWRWLGLAGLALGASILGGHLQIAALGIGLSFTYAFLCGEGPIPKRALTGIAATALGLAIGAARLAPALVELSESSRERIPFERWHGETASLTPSRLVLILSPDLLGDPVALELMPHAEGEVQANPQELRFSPGVAALVLALAAASRRRNRALVGMGLGALALAMPTALAWPLWRFAPGFGSTAPVRVLAVFPLLLALLAGEGWDEWRAGTRSLRGPTIAVLAALGAIAAALLAGRLSVPLDGRTGGPLAPLAVLAGRGFQKPLGLALLAVAVAFSGKGNPAKLARAALLALVVFDLAEATVRWNPTSPPARLYPETPVLQKCKEVAGSGRLLADRGVPPDVLLPLGLRGIGSYGSAHPARFERFVDAVAPSRSGRASKQWLYAWRLPAAWRDALAVRAVLLDPLDREGKEPSVPTGLEPAARGEVLLFRNASALPRARLLPRQAVVLCENEEEALRVAADPRFDPRTRVTLEPAPEAPLAWPGPAASTEQEPRVEIVEETAESVKIRTSWESSGLLFLADTLASGWTATLDGKPATIFPADVAFRGVPVPAGEHEVVFSFLPPCWPQAPFASALAALGSAVLLVFAGRSAGSQEEQESQEG